MKFGYVASLALIFSVATLCAATSAEPPPAASSQGMVRVYGEQLDLKQTRFHWSDYSWKELTPRLAQILPPAASVSSLGAEKVCETLHGIYNDYAEKADTDAQGLSFLLGFAYQSDDPGQSSEIVLSEKLGSTSPQVADELKKALLHVQRRITEEKTLEKRYGNRDMQAAVEKLNIDNEIKIAKNSALNSLTAIMVYNASLAQCPAWAGKNQPVP